MALNPGFDFTEALDLVALCGIIEGGNAPPQPAGWTTLFDSPVIGPFTDKWQLWKNAAGVYAVVLRGTVPTAGSIIEDLISFLVPAIGRLTVGHVQIDYKFAGRTDASIHFGFALGTLLLLKDPQYGILAQLADKVPPGSAIFVAGHSQGAAMATLLRSYLAYGADAPKDKNYAYKTYVFAQPKPGNDHYAADFESAFCNSDLAFRITNSLDWVPQVPFTLEIPNDINTPNPLSALIDPKLAVILAAIKPLFVALHDHVVEHSQARLQPKAALLAQRVAPATAGPATAAGFDVTVLPSLNFLNAGTEIALIGTPCVDAQCSDGFFEHHTITYYDLMKAQLGIA